MGHVSSADKVPELSDVRDKTIGRLGEAYADDVLLRDEYERRVLAARRAKNQAELDALVADIEVMRGVPRGTVRRARDSERQRARKDRAETLKPEDAAALRVFRQTLLSDPSSIRALRGAASVLRRADNTIWDDEEVGHLALLDDLTDLSETELARLGYLRYRGRDYFDAIEWWSKAVPKSREPAYLYFNLGLAYSQIGQDADAVDMWRQALNVNPDYERPKRELERILPRLLALADAAGRGGATMLDRTQWYAVYLNPFELLDLGEDADLSDERQIAKRRKVVLHEIELEDGHLPWLSGISVGRSRALSVFGELHDARLRRHHARVYADKRLLAFLSRGAHRHFLVEEDGGLLSRQRPEFDGASENSRNHDFREWLSGYFATQFDQVLATAVERRDLAAIECLVDGRRWVVRAQDDDCFQRARRVIDRLIEQLAHARTAAERKKPSCTDIERIMKRTRVDAILNLLPSFFESQRDTALRELRSLAITSFNTHHDSDLSRQILQLTSRFQFKSLKWKELLGDDFKQIERVVRDERKHEVRLRQHDEAWEITKEGVLQSGRFVPIKEIISVRTSARSAGSMMDYAVVFRVPRPRDLSFTWTASDPTLHEMMLKAIFMYVLPKLVERVESRMKQGETVEIGPCILTESGVGFSILRWFRWQRHEVPWHRVDAQLSGGVMTVSDRQQTRVRVSCSVHETDNAMVLSALAHMHGEREERK